MMWLFLLVILSNVNIGSTIFSPDTSDYEAYGVKVAANDVLFVEANGEVKTFLVVFAPYNYTFDSMQCSINYDDPAHYVYSVGVGSKQNASSNATFYFAGEVSAQSWTNADMLGRNGSYIGVWINQDRNNAQYYSNNHQPLPCNFFRADQFQFLSSYGHQEYYVIAVEPYGKYAIGLAASFAFIYQPYPTINMTTRAGSAIWPTNVTFYPSAADASETFTIVAGFVAGSARSRVRATPAVYLIWNSNLTILSTWSYSATNGSWQSRLTYSRIDSWNNQYTMSVKINSKDSTRVLVGMPFLNMVFLFVVSNNGTALSLADSRSNGVSVGFGKSVAWLTESQATILANTYSIDYMTWYSSQIYVYLTFSGTSIPSSPSVTIPNVQQPMPSTVNSHLIQLVSTPASVAALDVNGGALLVLAEAPGYYASTDTSKSPVAAAMPVVSHSTACIGGTYKSDSGVHPCVLCPNGTRNPGFSAGVSCTSCSSTSFCPTGAVVEVDSSSLISVKQAYAYPRSPEMDVFEDILLNNMFQLGSTPHCVVVSPIFWSLILLILVIVLLVAMASMNWCLQPETRDRWRKTIKNVFLRADLVGEGELWLGGLASILIILLTAMAYAFAMSYLNQYPSEKVGESTFACDSTIRNAKFQSNLQALAVPVTDEEQPMFNLLNDQVFTLKLDFINTNTMCASVFIYEVIESSSVLLTTLPCSSTNGTLSIKVVLPQHDITVKAVLNDIQLVGGARVGLSGPGQQNGSYTLLELNFIETFYSSSGLTLAQQVSIDMAMTKVVNETEPLYDDENSEFGGIWYPTFTYSLSEMFISANSYATLANLTSTTLTIDITETSYYIKNTQSPIAKRPEIIFRTLLFAFLCLELCAMTFLIVKLLLIPLVLKIYTLYTGRRPNNAVRPEHELKANHHHHDED